MRPIPAARLGHAHGLLRAIDKRGRLRTDEFVTEFKLDELFPPNLENAVGGMRHLISFTRLAGLVREDRGVVELTEVGKRYVRAGDPEAPFDVSPQQAEWLRRQLREKHMTDSIFHGLAIGLSLLASVPPGTRVATLDFGRSMAYLGRAGWDNENTLTMQGERHLVLLRELELIDADRELTETGRQIRTELTLPIHMSLIDLAAQLNPGGATAVRAAAAAEWPEPEPEPEPVSPPDAEEPDENGYHTVLGSFPTVEPPSQPPIVPRATPADVPVTPPPDHPPSPSFADPLLPFVGRGPSTPPPPTPPDTPWRAGSVPPPVPVPDEAPPDEAPAVETAPPLVAPDAAPAVEPPSADVDAETPRESTPPPVRRPGLVPDFVDAALIRAAAIAAGLRLPAGVYANVAAGLATGKHLILTGPPGSGKTTLAMVIARAAAQAGRAHGATVVTAEPHDLLLEAAEQGRWLIIDALGDDTGLESLSTFLAGIPVSFGNGREVTPADGWRIVATAERVPAAIGRLRRFAAVEVADPTTEELRAALRDAAGDDPVAVLAAERLLAIRDIHALGAAVFLDAAKHAAARNAVAPADEKTLTREAFAAYLAPLLDEAGRERAEQLLDS